MTTAFGPDYEPRFRQPRETVEWYRQAIRGMACAVLAASSLPTSRIRCVGRIQPAHLKTQGSWGPDIGNIVPLCVAHHKEQHGMAPHDFDAKYKIGLHAIALDIARRLLPGQFDG